MRLSFLGNSYEAPSTPVESMETEQMASFMGKKYKVQRHTVSHRSAFASFKYRGVDYTA